MKLLVFIFLFLASISIALSVSATETTENPNDTIETQCQSGKLVSLVKFHSGLLGNVHIFYDCLSKNVYMNDSKETNAPLEFTFAVDNSDLTLIFYPPVASNQAPRSRKIEVDLSKDPTVTVTDQNTVEKRSFNRRGILSHSLQNFPFLQSISNVPGWETIDSDS